MVKKNPQEAIEMALQFLDTYSESANGRENLAQFLHRWESDRSHAPTEEQAQAELTKSLEKLSAYLAMVPIGNKSMKSVYSKEFSPTKKKLYEQCGGVCQLCGNRFELNRVVAHHTNYFKADDPKYLRIVCLDCHRNIGVLTGLVRWIARATHIAYIPPQPVRTVPTISRRS